jgi:hypothetical protein
MCHLRLGQFHRDTANNSPANNKKSPTRTLSSKTRKTTIDIFAGVRTSGVTGLPVFNCYWQTSVGRQISTECPLSYLKLPLHYHCLLQHWHLIRNGIMIMFNGTFECRVLIKIHTKSIFHLRFFICVCIYTYILSHSCHLHSRHLT